jgi:hypothetical protein
MKSKQHEAGMFRALVMDLFCAVFCGCPAPRKIPVVKVSFGRSSFTCKGDFMAQVPDTGGPFTATIQSFVDAKDNPTTESDVPTWTSSDDTVATVAADPANPQSATVTLTGKTGQVQIAANFPDASGGGSGPAYAVTGTLDVMPGDAVSASMVFAGPGL